MGHRVQESGTISRLYTSKAWRLSLAVGIGGRTCAEDVFERKTECKHYPHCYIVFCFINRPPGQLFVAHGTGISAGVYVFAGARVGAQQSGQSLAGSARVIMQL